MKKSVRLFITLAVLLLAGVPTVFAQAQTPVSESILSVSSGEEPYSILGATLPGPDYHLNNAIAARRAIALSISTTSSINRSIARSLAGAGSSKSKKTSTSLLNTGPLKISVKTKSAGSFVRQMLNLFPGQPEMQQFITARYANLPKRAYYITLKLTF